MKSIKKLDENDLSELIDLISRLSHEMQKYSHVIEFLPKNIKNNIDKFSKKLMIECEKRENEF